MRSLALSMYSFIQINLNRARVAQALLPQTMHETKADIAIVSEPNKIPALDGWYGSTDQTSAIYLSPDKLTLSVTARAMATCGLTLPSCAFTAATSHRASAIRLKITMRFRTSSQRVYA